MNNTKAETETPPAGIPVTEETGRFCPTSLEDWLALCQVAGVAHVPAELITTINREDWLMFDQDGEHAERLRRAIREAQDKLTPEHMIRYDFCAPLETKIRMSRGLPGYHPDMGRIQLDDPRAYEILWEQPRERIPVYQRPWTEPRTAEGYPVEYRAFVRDGTILGISSYYPQRPLPLNRGHLQQVETATTRLAQAAPTPFLWNENPMRLAFFERHDPAAVHFTADFLVTQQDKVLFLEGGPPHEMGAHPCCFPPGEIQGIALSDRNAE